MLKILPSYLLRQKKLMQSSLPAYAELHCLSNFTFLRGASHPRYYR